MQFAFASALIRVLHTARRWYRLKKASLRPEGTYCCISPEGLRILLKGDKDVLQSTLNIWFKEQNLLLSPIKRKAQANWPADLILSSLSRQQRVRHSSQKESEPLLFTQPYVEMDVPLRPDFEQFLYEVLPKKRRTYIRKAQKFPYRTELSRDTELLAFFLKEILNPSTEDRHGGRSQILRPEDVTSKGENWELLLLRNEAGEILGGNLLLRSRWQKQKQLRIWRQAAHPRLNESSEKHDILLLLNTAPLELACREGLDTVSFGISPHLMDDSNFYSKRLWACRPSWNDDLSLLSIKVGSEKGKNFLEQKPLLCESPSAASPDAVLVPKAWIHPDSQQQLSDWLNKYGFHDLHHVAVLEGDRIEFQKISALQPPVT